jgi:hypothetical protein
VKAAKAKFQAVNKGFNHFSAMSESFVIASDHSLILGRTWGLRIGSGG